MQSSRRHLLKQFLFVSAGSALLPSCLLVPQHQGIKLKHIEVNSDQEMLLACLASTLIPSNDGAGAKETATDLFVWKMLDDCTGEQDQKKFIKGLNAFGKIAQEKLGKFFINASDNERAGFIKSIELQNDRSVDIVDFYFNAKKRIVQAYAGSAYFLTNVQVYEQIPARFHGSVLIKQ